MGKEILSREKIERFHCLIKEMKLHDHALFFAYFLMSPAKYEHLFGLLTATKLNNRQ